jgi:hypothetical protein
MLASVTASAMAQLHLVHSFHHIILGHSEGKSKTTGCACQCACFSHPPPDR